MPCERRDPRPFSERFSRRTWVALALLKPPAHLGYVAFATMAFLLNGSASTAQDEVAADASNESSADASNGVLPSLNAFLPANSPLRLRFPDAFVSDGVDEVYDRRFPIGGQEAVDRGITLPKPYGITVAYIENVQAQKIDTLSVALGRGEAPPPGTDLVDLPFVRLENVESRTRTSQIRGDMWVLPFLNIFGALGDVDGEVPLDVVVDLNEVLPPSACPPLDPCDEVRANFEAGVDTNTVTLGATAVYGWENWYLTGSASATASFGGDTEDAVRSYSASSRFGRRWVWGPGHIVSPYVGVDYLHLDQIVEGTTRLPDAFPNGDSLDVRYRARIQNTNKWSAIVGMNFGFIQGFSINAEANFNEANSRTVVSATYRF